MSSEIQCPPRCIVIADRDWQVTLCPEIGGAIVNATWRGRPVLHDRSTEALETRNVRRMACYPLVPYSNRIGHARFSWLSQVHSLRPNFPGEPHAIHGFGWQRAWDVKTQTDTTVAMTLCHAPDADWPYACRVCQTISLHDGDLLLELSIVNAHSTTMPAGLGWHPFFPLSDATRLQTDWTSMFEMDADHLPADHVEVAGQLDFSTPQPLANVEVDHCFAGWSGRASIQQDDHVLHLRAAGTPAAVLMRPGREAFFALEPVSHLNNALQFEPARQIAPMQDIAPGEGLSIAMRLSANTPPLTARQPLSSIFESS